MMKCELSLHYRRRDGGNVMLGARQVSVPEGFKDVGSYGKLIYKRKVHGIFKVNYRDAPGSQLFVREEDAGGVPDQSNVILASSTKWRFGTYDLFTSSSKLSSFIGLLLAVAGVLIDVFLAIDKVKPDLWSVASTTAIILMLVSMLFKVTGLLLIFFRGLLQ